MNMRYAWRVQQHWRHCLLAVCGLLALMPVMAQNAIESVTGSLQGGSEVLKIDLRQELSVSPTGFTIQTPARIALDFPGVVSSMARPTVEVNQGNLRSVTVVQAGDRTRVVLNLKQASGYKTQLQGKSVLVFLEPSVGVSGTRAVPTAQVSADSSANPVQNVLKDVDFRRNVDGAGRVIVTLPTAQAGVGVQQQGQTLVVEFPGATLPEGLRRRLDVSDFGTPVQTVSTFQAGDRVRMVIEPKGQWEHSAYQSDDQFVVEVKPLKADPGKLSPGVGFTGQKLSLNFQNIEVRSLLQVIADFTGFNVVTSDSVSGSVTLRLLDVPWDQAMDIILRAKGLGVRKAGNVLWIAPNEEILTKEKLERESRVALDELEAVQTQSFQLNYAKALDVARQLMGAAIPGLAAPAPVAAPGGAARVPSGRILSLRGSAIPEVRTNQLFVTDIPSKIEQVRQLILKLDIPVRQVLIEARIVEAEDSFGKALGVRLGGGGPAAATESGGYQFGGSYSATSAGAAAGNFVNLPAAFPSGVSALVPTGASAPAFAVSIFGEGAARFLNLEISALEADNKGKVVSSPRVVTADKTKALIEQGTELPYQMATASGATSIAFRKANLKLEVTPQITPEGNIILDLDVNKDTVGQTTPAGFAIDTKHVQTQVLVENGGTVVIGGIFTMDETEGETKVPFFGDLPIMGNLFKSRNKKSIKKEMLVFITPKTLVDKTVSR